MIKVGIGMRVTEETNYFEQRDAISHDWIIFLNQLGCIPVLIPNLIENIPKFLEEMGITHLLLTGGNSIIYDAKTLHWSKSQRDITEVECLNFAREKSLPVLGVCRGFQLINLVFGGGLTCKAVEHHTNHVAQNHVVIECESGQTFNVNSFHQDLVLRAQLAPSLECVAYCDDVVEAFQHQSETIFAMQWHPEREGAENGLTRKLITNWLNR